MGVNPSQRSGSCPLLSRPLSFHPFLPLLFLSHPSLYFRFLLSLDPFLPICLLPSTLPCLTLFPSPSLTLLSTLFLIPLEVDFP